MTENGQFILGYVLVELSSPDPDFKLTVVSQTLTTSLVHGVFICRVCCRTCHQDTTVVLLSNVRMKLRRVSVVNGE